MDAWWKSGGSRGEAKPLRRAPGAGVREAPCEAQEAARGARRSRLAGPGHAVAGAARVDDAGGVRRAVAGLAAEVLRDGERRPGAAVALPAPPLARQGPGTGAARRWH